MTELSLMGVFELRERLGGVSRQRADQITRQPGFPKPCATLVRGRLWRTEEIEDWIRTHRPTRAAHPQKPIPPRPTTPRTRPPNCDVQPGRSTA